MVFNSCCGFTGFRPGRFSYKYDEDNSDCLLLKHALYGKIYNKCCNGVNTFYTGMAMGIDIWAAEAVLDIKKNFFFNVNLIAVIPFNQHESTLRPSYFERYENILQSCSDIVYVCDDYNPESYKIRNEYIVEHCNSIIAVYDENNPILRSGTGSTVRYAQKLNRDITFIHPYSPMIA